MTDDRSKIKNMKKQILVLTLTAISFISFAQPWTVNPAEYEFTMNIIGQVSISGTIEDNASNYIGAFVDDVCVGVCSPVEDAGEYKLFYLTVYSNQSSDETVEFKFVDASETETLISNTVVFESDGIIGDADAPFIWFDTEEYASTDILEFSFNEQVSPAEINTTAHTVSVLVENGTDLTNLIPDFLLAPGATAEVNSVQQESGVTANDYSSDVVYVITGADESTANWTITVTVDESGIDDFDSEMVSVYPNPASDYIIISSDNFINYHVQIIDQKGKILLTNKLLEENLKLSISELSKGLYFIIFVNEKNEKLFHKLIIQ